MLKDSAKEASKWNPTLNIKFLSGIDRKDQFSQMPKDCPRHMENGLLTAGEAPAVAGAQGPGPCRTWILVHGLY